MSVIIYARVSTGAQAEHDLSIPAQIRLCRKYAEQNHWAVAHVLTDVGTGRRFRDRKGLLDAMHLATRDKSIRSLLVHKVDRVARNTLDYLTIKTRLRERGIAIVSAVEHFEANPMGDFLEHIMAAQAEFHSANLALEVKKGMEERVRRGGWISQLPVGYLRSTTTGRPVLDPARGHLVRIAFDRWASGTITSIDLADEMHRRGLVSKRGGKITATQWCFTLKNPFYVGKLLVRGELHDGEQPALVSKEVFDRCQSVFTTKRAGRQPRRKILFLLAGKIECPRCARLLVGEEHTKPSGLVYRYYRCHTIKCAFTLRTDVIEAQVKHELMAMRLPETLLPELRARADERTRHQAEHQTQNIVELTQEITRLHDQQEVLRIRMVATTDQSVVDEITDELAGLRSAEQIARRLIHEAQVTNDETDPDDELRATIEQLPEVLQGGDIDILQHTIAQLIKKVCPARIPSITLSVRPTLQ